MINKLFRTWRVLLLTTMCAMNVSAQIPDSVRGTFRQPFDFPVLFSGNFGELRANHFHGGLDFKTQGTIGKHVHALADGYISRIRVTHGSGYVLDVVHKNGYTAIFRHLSRFTDALAKRIKSLQYEQERWEVEIIASPDEYPVKQGQVIAYSGNTGYSFGPHLHLDVIETQTDEYIDPLPLFATSITDRQAPQARSITIFPKQDRGVVNGSNRPETFPINHAKSIMSWGQIGVGICAYDYMDGASNRYGVKYVTLTVDDKEVFRSEVNRFEYHENRYINSWTAGNTMKSFIEPGNKLRMLYAEDSTRGWIQIDEERPYQLRYKLCDAWGNSSEINFTIIGHRQEMPKMNRCEKYYFRWNKHNHLQEPGLELTLPLGTLYDDVYLDYNRRGDSADIAFTYHLSSDPIKLHKPGRLRIGMRHLPTNDVSKYYIASIGKNNKLSCMGGKFVDGYLETDILSLGTYTIMIDTIPPTIQPISRATWLTEKRIRLKPQDSGSGINSYRATIDGEYIPMGKPNAVNGILEYVIDRDRIKPNRKNRLLKVEVSDNCGNITIGEYNFVY